MTRKQIIKKLSADLATLLDRTDNVELIEHYINAAMVTEIERLKLNVGIFVKICPKTGVILGEYIGIDEIYNEIKTKGLFKPSYETVQKAINNVILGKRSKAYSFMWKQI